jgi:hypothetical protein
MADRSDCGQYQIRFVLNRGEWAATEWPALVFRVGWAAFLLLAITLAAACPPWWALLLLAWWPMGGAKATGILLFILRGAQRIALNVGSDGIISASANGSDAVYCYWIAFQDCGMTYLLWGADGRFRLIVPKRALTSADYAALHQLTGVDLAKLRLGQEGFVKRCAANV